MSRPTAFDPVNAMKRVFGCSTMALPNVAPDPGQKFTTPPGIPASSRTSTNFAAIVGESLEGLRITVLPGHDRSRRHPRHDREREIPRRNHRSDAQRNVKQFIMFARRIELVWSALASRRASRE